MTQFTNTKCLSARKKWAKIFEFDTGADYKSVVTFGSASDRTYGTAVSSPTRRPALADVLVDHGKSRCLPLRATAWRQGQSTATLPLISLGAQAGLPAALSADQRQRVRLATWEREAGSRSGL